MRPRPLPLLLPLALLLACDPMGATPDPTPTAEGFSRQKMLRDMGEGVILPTLAAFADRAGILKSHISAWQSSQGSGDAGGEAVALEAARGAFAQAMDAWQRAEVMQVGPAGSASTFTGGQNLRDTIYSWPTVNPCRVDQEVVSQGYAQAGYFDTALVNVYGLDALEYLLYAPPGENTCPPQVAINAEGTWAALSDAEIQARRAAYAHAVAAHLAAQAAALHSAWSPEGGDFLSAFAQAGEASSPYPSAQQALDEVYAALFYLELKVKDEKLAEPAGLASTCASVTCPEALESQWAKRSRENVLANLEGFEALFAGGEGWGMDDLLADVGAPELGVQIQGDVAAAIAETRGLSESFEALLTREEPAPVIAIHDRVKLVTDPFKGQVVTLLNLTIPSEGAGDND